MIGTHTVAVYPLDTPGDFDPAYSSAFAGGISAVLSCQVDDVSIAHGRADTNSQPAPSSATVNVTMGPAEPLPAGVEIGALLTVATLVAGATFRRFTGRVTDVSLGWDDAGQDTPDAGVGQIIAVGALADYARRVVGAEPFPQELDGARVARVFALAGATLAEADPGLYEVIPRDVDAKAALDIAHGVATSARGLVWETRAGTINYADEDHRRDAPLALVLDACDILVTPTWQRNTAGLVNDVTVSYGVAPEGGQRPTYEEQNEDSKARFGLYEYSSTVELADRLDVVSAASMLLIQNGAPVWMLQALPIDMGGLPAPETLALLGLDMHALIQVDGLPVTGPTPTTITAWVEGWTETLSWGVHDLELSVSDFCRTNPPPRWDDVPAAMTWDTADPATWDEWACLGPPAVVPARELVSVGGG